MYEMNYSLISWKNEENKEDVMDPQWHEGQDFTTRECNSTT